jgi:chromosome segregation ATPase
VGFASYIRNLFGAASKGDLDAASVAATSAADARAAADEMKALVARAKDDHALTIREVESELARLSARVEAMPEMRAQLETFVHSLGRTMTGAADRLEHVDDRLQHMEQQSRSQTEILSMSRAELDRQGRALGALESQMKSLEEAITRLADATERTQSLVRDFEERKVRSSAAAWTAIAAACVAVLAVLFGIFR